MEFVSGLLRKDLRVIQQVVLFQLQLDDRGGERRGIDRNIDLLENIRDRSDMVLMTVRDDHAANAIAVGLQIGNVGDNHIHAIEILIRETHAAVDEKNILTILVDSQVLSDLTQTAKRYDFQFIRCHSILLLFITRTVCRNCLL